MRAQKYDSVLKSICCSCKFCSQHPCQAACYSNSRKSDTPFWLPRALAYIHTDYTLILKKENQFFFVVVLQETVSKLILETRLVFISQRSTCLCLLSAVVKDMCHHIHYSTIDSSRNYQLMIFHLPGTATYPSTRKVEADYKLKVRLDTTGLRPT